MGGLLGGAAVAAVVSYLLVKVLTGIFDPPPTSAAVPSGYLIVLAGAVLLSSGAVVLGVGRLARRAGPKRSAPCEARSHRLATGTGIVSTPP